jgi:DNA ligase (NAD+)
MTPFSGQEEAVELLKELVAAGFNMESKGAKPVSVLESDSIFAGKPLFYR